MSVCGKMSTLIAKRRVRPARKFFKNRRIIFYGERQYRARDPEGHVWTFSQTVRVVPKDEAERLSGLRIKGWHR